MTLQSSPVADDKAAVQPSESYSCETRQLPACSTQQHIASLMSIAVTGCWIKTIISEGQNSHVLSIITAPSFHPEAAVWHAFVQNLERKKF